jgi:hypothetical protein
MHTPAVVKTRLRTLNEYVPEKERAVLVGIQLERLKRLTVIGLMEQQQLHTCGIAAEYREIDATAGVRRARRKTLPAPRFSRVLMRSQPAHQAQLVRM